MAEMEKESRALSEEIAEAASSVHRVGEEIAGTQEELNALTEQVNRLLRQAGQPELEKLDVSWVEEFQKELEREIIVPEILTKVKRMPELSREDIVAACVCGLLAALVDFILVGTPQMKKGMVEGAPINQLLRRIDGDSGIFKWLSDHCKVPYDVSAVKDVVYAKNHRLRSFAHDPLFGALFALMDIVLGTTTCINNRGEMVMLLQTNPNATRNGWLFLVYYLGHLLSDAFTSCGLPVPGWFMTQFFASGDDSSLARAAESMYQDGFDCRQLIGMEASAQLGAQLANFYVRLAHPAPAAGTGAEAEILQMRHNILHKEIRCITAGVASAGNVLKILLPPASGNLAGINLPQWREFAWDGLYLIKAATRDMSVENVLENRKNINRMWNILNEDF